MAEDYAAFDVDVTTEEPADPASIGSRCAIGGSSYDWCVLLNCIVGEAALQ